MADTPESAADLDALLRDVARAPALRPPEPASGGHTLGPYRLDRRLGAGGNGVVYRASDERLQRQVALKVLWADGDDGPERMLAEARSLAALSHPGLITVFEVAQYEGITCLAMELADGPSLRQCLETQGLTGPEVLRVATQLAEALAWLHTHGWVHRDVKPDNLSLNGATLKLLDFGTARRLGPGLEGAPVAGTPGYQPPEVLAGAPATPAADVYAFGVTLREALASVAPARRGPLSLWRALHQLADRCTQAPSHRPPTATPLVEALQRLGPARTASRGLWLTLVAFALASMALGWALWRREPTPPHSTERRLTARAHDTWVTDVAPAADGSALALIEGGRFVLQSLTQAAPTPPPPAPPALTSVAWRSETQWLVASASGVWALEAAKAPRQLTREPADLIRISADGSRAAIASGPTVSILTLTEPISLGPPLTTGAAILALGWSADGHSLAVVRLVSDAESQVPRLDVIDVTTGITTQVLQSRALALELGVAAVAWSDAETLGWASPATEAGQPSAVLWSQRIVDGRPVGTAQQRHRFASGTPNALTFVQQRLVLLLLRTQTDTLLGALNGTQWVSPAPVVKGDYQERPSSWSPDSQTLAFTSDGPQGLHAALVAPGGTVQPLAHDDHESVAWPVFAGTDVLTWRWPSAAETDEATLVRTSLTGDAGAQTLFSVPRVSFGQGSQLPPANARVRCAARAKTCWLGRWSEGQLRLAPFDAAEGTMGPPLTVPFGTGSTVHGFDVSSDGGALVIAGPGATLLSLDVSTGARTTHSVPTDCEAQHVSFSENRALWVTARCAQPPSFRLFQLSAEGAVTLVHATDTAWLGHPLPSPDGRWLALASRPIESDVWALEPAAR